MNKLAQLQICRMKEIYEYTCEFRKWYNEAFDNNVNDNSSKYIL